MSDYDDLTAHCHARLGKVLNGKWRLEQVIGVGGMAAVYASTHRNGARGAIKILHADLTAHPEARSRFLREAYIANKVEHPAAVKVFDDDITEDGEPYLVMELLQGESVDERARRCEGRLSAEEVLWVADKTLELLELAHGVGVLHRDLKPENLFVTNTGELKVLDFGIARLRESAEGKGTKTGMLMGTPAFMAPEQALGRWSLVDARTDLWAVGAIIYTLLTGRCVHEGDTDSVTLVAAATRPASSLARMLPSAPIELVRLTDRALAYDMANRFPDATTMRGEVVRLRGGVPATAQDTQPKEELIELPDLPLDLRPPDLATGVTVPAPKPAPAGPQPATMAEESMAQPAPLDVEVAIQQLEATADTYDASFASERDISDMQELFMLIDRALIAKRQYGVEHSEGARRMERAFTFCCSALMQSDSGLVWNVTPFSFAAKGKTLWEPQAPFDTVPYQLFADGVRTLALLPGLTEEEFLELLRILTLDRATEAAPEDDSVTLLWEACFEHIAHQAIDTFADGDQKDREKFAADQHQIMALARFDTSFQMEDCWQERGSVGADEGVEAKGRRLLGMLAGDETVDKETAARAASLPVDPGALRTMGETVLRVDEHTLTMLAARLQVDTMATGERFAVAAARAYADTHRRGSSGFVTAPVRAALDGLAAERADMAVELVVAVGRALSMGRDRAEAEPLRAAMTGELISGKTMERILAGATSQHADRKVFIKGLKTILGYLDSTHVPIVLGSLLTIEDEELSDAFIDYLSKNGQGHEAAMGALFPDANIELGLALLHILVEIPTPEARDAIAQASKSPHAVVRIQALGHVEGASSERLRLELRSLLQDREPHVRSAALNAMKKYQIRVAGPFLVMRIRADDFDKLPIEERRLALSTVATLAPSRAEAVCIEVLGEGRLIPTDAHEQTRAAAAELLGTMRPSQEILTALETAATGRWRNSETVRRAAANALDALRSSSSQGGAS